MNDTFLFTKVRNTVHIASFLTNSPQLLSNPTFIVYDFACYLSPLTLFPSALNQATIVIRDGIVTDHSFSISGPISGGSRLIVHNVTCEGVVLGAPNMNMTLCSITHNCTISLSNMTTAGVI